MSPRSFPKKRKTTSSVVGTKDPKKARYDAETPVEAKSSKGKSRETQFQVVQARLLLSISPVFTRNPRSGVEEMLDSMIMRYIPGLQGIVLSHSNIKFLDDKASIKADCPFLVCQVSFDATVWSPRIGMKLGGRISVCSPDHISILIHRTFNVSIPRHHIPDYWEFEYGPADNDPEFGPDVLAEWDKPEEESEHTGRWVHKTTGTAIGGDAKHLDFVVIGLTIANEMLSVVGSLQPDPFSPTHLVHPKLEHDGKEDDLDEEPVPLRGEPGHSTSDDDSDPYRAFEKRGDAEPRMETEEPVKKKKKRKNEGDTPKHKKKSKRKHE